MKIHEPSTSICIFLFQRIIAYNTLTFITLLRECYIQNYPISKQFQPTLIIDLQIMAHASKSLTTADNLSIYTAQSKLYHFPDITVLGKQFNTAQEISHKLDLLLKNYNNINESSKIEKSFIMREAEGGMLFKCRVRGCLAFLKFNYTSSGRLLLAKSDIEHQHKMCPRMKGRTPKVRSSEIEECFDQLQLLNFKPGEIASFIRQRFRISKPHFYAIKYQRKRRDNIKALLMALSKFDNFFFQCRDLQQLAAHYRNQQPPPVTKIDQDVVIVVSRKMKQLYEQYHCNYVVFSIFPDLVLQTRYAKKLKYHHMCLLYGEDSTCQLNLLFGIVIIRRPAKLAYLYVMEKLFTFLGKYPKVLISDYDPNLAQAVRRLQRRSENANCIRLHIQLPNSFISNTLQGRTNSQFISIISNDLQGLLRQPDRHKHQQRFKQILKACQLNPPNTQAHIIDIVTKYVTNNSIVNLPPYFIGLTMMPYSVATELRARVLDFFKSPRPMVLALKAFFEIFQAYPVLKFLSKDQIQNRLFTPKQHFSKKQKLHLLATVGKAYEPTTRLRTATKALAHPVALCFADSLQKCFNGRIQMKRSRGLYFKVAETKSHYSYQVHITNEVRRGEVVKVYRCNCHYYAKVGLPCWHEIKACIEERSCIINQINPFWLKKLKIVQSSSKSGPNQHDIKVWNDDQLTKLAEAEQRQLMADVATVVQSVIGMDQVKTPQTPGEYNIKINSNPSSIPGYSNIDLNPDSSQAGLFDLINQLQGVDWNRQDEDNLTSQWQDNASSKVSQPSQLGYTSNPYTSKAPNYQNRSVISNHTDHYRQPSYLSPAPTYHFPLPYHTQQQDLNMDFQIDNYSQQNLNSLSMYWNQPSQLDYLGSKKAFQYQERPYSEKPKCFNFFDDQDEDDIDDDVDDVDDQEEEQIVEDNNQDNDSQDDWERRSLTKIIVRTNYRGEIEDDQVVEVEHPKKKRDKDTSRSGNQNSKSGKSQIDLIRSNRSVRSVNKQKKSINLIDNDDQF